MAKSILIINTPKNCEECRCSAMVHGKLYCPARDTVVRKGERDCSCPLVAVPERMDPEKARGAYDATRIEAWNKCIDKILGGSNE